MRRCPLSVFRLGSGYGRELVRVPRPAERACRVAAWTLHETPRTHRRFRHLLVVSAFYTSAPDPEYECKTANNEEADGAGDGADKLVEVYWGGWRGR